MLEAIDPFGQRRVDVHYARLMALMANMMRDAKTKPDPFTSEDFLLRFEAQETAPMDVESIKTVMMVLAKEFPSKGELPEPELVKRKRRERKKAKAIGK